MDAPSSNNAPSEDYSSPVLWHMPKKPAGQTRGLLARAYWISCRDVYVQSHSAPIPSRLLFFPPYLSIDLPWLSLSPTLDENTPSIYKYIYRDVYICVSDSRIWIRFNWSAISFSLTVGLSNRSTLINIPSASSIVQHSMKTYRQRNSWPCVRKWNPPASSPEDASFGLERKKYIVMRSRRTPWWCIKLGRRSRNRGESKFYLLRLGREQRVSLKDRQQKIAHVSKRTANARRKDDVLERSQFFFVSSRTRDFIFLLPSRHEKSRRGAVWYMYFVTDRKQLVSHRLISKKTTTTSPPQHKGTNGNKNL